MRWLLGRSAGTCDACGAELERGAAWCGACGARTDDGDRGGQRAVLREAQTDPADGPEDGAEEGADDTAPLARRGLAAVVVIALIALVVASQLRSPAAEPRLGHLGEATAMSATGPPPSGLRLAWSYEPPGPTDGMHGAWPRAVVADAGRVRVGNLVVDQQGGQLIAVTPDLQPVTGTGDTIIDGRELLVVDTLSGAVRSRVPLSDDLLGLPVWRAHRGHDASLLQVERDSVLVADDGSVVAEVEGGFLDYVDRAFGNPAAFPLRGRITEDELTTPVRLVSTDTGEVVADFPEPRTRVVDVSGDLALVASTDATVNLYQSPPAAGDVVWTVELLDARTGERWAQLSAVSREPPRLVGRFGDGTVVVATRIGDEYPLLAVTPAGEVSRIAQLGRRSRPADTGFIVQSTALTSAALAGDVLVVTQGGGEVVGLDRTGTRLWELDVPGTAGIRGGGGHVALFGHEDSRIRLVRASDGEAVGVLDPPEPPWAVAETVGLPIATIDGHVGISRAGPYLAPHQGALVETTWFDLRTGDRATLEDVFGRFAGDEDRVGVGWVLHGLVTGEQGALEPVVSRTQPQSQFELLDPGEGFRTYRLPLPSTAAPGGVPAFGVLSAGASADGFVVWGEGVRNPADMATVVLDRRDGNSLTLEGLRGVLLLEDLLLAEEIDESYAVTALVGMDTTTGEERWRADPHVRFPGEEFLHADRELVVDIGVARVTARSTDDGAQRWSHASDVTLSGEVVLGSRHVVVTTTHGEVVALDRSDGTVAWRTSVGAPIGSMTGAGDHVLLGTHDGLVVHLDGRGAEVQRIAVGTGAVHAVAALGETVVAVVDGRVVGLRTDGDGITPDDEVELP